MRGPQRPQEGPNAPWPGCPASEAGRRLRAALAAYGGRRTAADPAADHLRDAVRLVVADLESHDLRGWEAIMAELRRLEPEP